MRLIKLTTLIASVFLTALALLVTPTVAATPPVSQGLSISPPTFNLSANPGDSAEHTIRVENLSAGAIPINAVVENFTAAGELGEVNITSGSEPYALASWTTVSPQTVTIPAKSSQVFTFTTNVPKNAEPGGRFGAIVFQVAPGLITNISGVAVGQEISSLVLLRVAGDAKEKASIAEFSTSTPSIEQGPVTFLLRIKNQGNVHLKPVGTITIADIFGHKVATLPVNSNNILPDAIRQFTATYAQQNLFGRYTATASLVYGSKQQTVTATTAFFIIPWKLLAIGAIVIAIIAFLMYRGRRRLTSSLKVLFGKGDE
ncbi:MAG TPA: DUF916 domain-containing protein [Candidatus Saccharimonadales bacterium]|nr:DUF916 domain-containing protein [Candidatus Saccharimonadales bacterium]